MRRIIMGMLLLLPAAIDAQGELQNVQVGSGPRENGEYSSPIYNELIQRSSMFRGLAVAPEPGVTHKQFSSYDRASKYDEATGAYVAWDANGDYDQYIRKEGEDTYVIAEMNGPGCINRIWSATPWDNVTEIYLDGAETPVVSMPFTQYFGSGPAPFNLPGLCYRVEGGMAGNCFIPIPYQKSCKVVVRGEWKKYYFYQIGYTTYPDGREIPSLTLPLAARTMASLERFNNRLLADRISQDPDGEWITKTIPPNETMEIWSKEGDGAIKSLRAQADLPEDIIAQRKALRELTISMFWDGETNPSVWSPFGDFFGTAPGANPYRSFSMGLTEDGTWYSRWFMPFANGAVIRVGNDGAEPRTVRFKVRDIEAPAGKMARFHVKWHRDAFLPTDTARAIDWPFLVTKGRGRFVGLALHVFNPNGGWWGEGDEKFFVDGEKFPSIFGTGSEDYFGYSWCSPVLFQKPFHMQTISMNNAGHISVGRWQIADSIPFQTEFNGCIEKYYPNDRPTHYAATAYWYLMPGGEDPYGPVDLAARLEHMDWTPPPPYVAEGAIEGETMDATASAGAAVPQELVMFEGKWSNKSQLWWTGAQPGATLDLKFQVEKDGSYNVEAQCTRAPDYGIVTFELDGAPVGEPLDGYAPGVTPTGVLSWGKHTLAAGEHTLRLTITGANPQAAPSYMAGLDYIALKPAE